MADLFRGGRARGEDEGAESDFLVGDKWAASSSPQIELVRYEAEHDRLWIQFSGGAVYSYAGVTYEEAREFYRGGLRNTWVWNVLRVRKSRTAHKKSYRLERFG